MKTYQFTNHDLSDVTELQDFAEQFASKPGQPNDFTVSRELQKTADAKLLGHVREYMERNQLGRDPAKVESDFRYALDVVIRKHPVLFQLGRADHSHRPDVTVVRLGK